MYKRGRIWGAVGFIVVLAMLPVAVWAESGNVDINAVVSGAEPLAAPSINEPSTNTTSLEKNIAVAGGCTDGLVVKVFSNNIFVGSTVCQSDNTYSLRVDLFIDRNELVALQVDGVNQPSPNSATVIVFYIPAEQQPELPGEEPQTPSEAAGQPSETGTEGQPSEPDDAVAEFQLAIDHDYTSHGAFVGQALRLPIHFVGGTGPYTVTVDWGDGSSNNFVRQNNDTFTADYIYNRAGLITITITIVDSTGQVSRLQFVALIHGDIVQTFTERVFGQLGQALATPALGVVVGVTFPVGIALGALSPLLFRLLRGLAVAGASYLVKLIK